MNNIKKIILIKDLFDDKDLTVYITDLENENSSDFVSYLIKNKIDSVITINAKSNNILTNIMQYHDLTDKRNYDHSEFDNRMNITHCRISFKPNPTQIVREENVRKSLPSLLTFAFVSADKYALNISPLNSKYSLEDKSLLSMLLLAALNDKTMPNKRTVLVCK